MPRTAVLLRTLTVLLLLAVLGITGGQHDAPASAAPRTAAATATAVTSTPTATTQPLRVMTWNICGEAGGATPLDAGYCPFRPYAALKADTIAKAAQRRDIDALLLQEICFDSPQGDSHLDLLKKALVGDEAPKSPLWEFAVAPMERPDGRTDCRGELHGTLGIAVAVKGHITGTTITELAPRSSTSSQSKMLCVQVDGWKSRVCGLHLPAGKADLSAEVATVLGVVAGDTDLVVGGDFNSAYPGSSTGSLKPLYDRFAECDAEVHTAGEAANEPTFYSRSATGADGKVDSVTYNPVKLDYIFSTAGFANCDSWAQMADRADYATTLLPSGLSDHAPLYGGLAGAEVPMLPGARKTVPAADVPTSTGCYGAPVGTLSTRTPKLQAYVGHTDPATPVHGEFSIWNSSDQTRPQPIVMGEAGSASTSVTGSGTVAVQVPTLEPGYRYGWRVRSSDATQNSAITSNCYFWVAPDAN